MGETALERGLTLIPQVCGVLWVRRPRTLDSGSLPDRGSVYLVTHFLPLPTYLSEAPDAEIRAHLPTYPSREM